MNRPLAFLFDLDGTLIDSLPAVERSWARYAAGAGLDPAEILPHIHGRRSLDTLRLLAPHLDAEVENMKLRKIETADTAGVRALAGSRSFTASLPQGSWTVVTSGTSDVAQARLRAVGIPIPALAVYGEDVENGKPHPEPFLLAAARLRVPADRCVAFEDTLAGVQSAKAAGCRVVAISEMHPGQEYPEADAVIKNLSEAVYIDGQIVIRGVPIN